MSRALRLLVGVGALWSGMAGSSPAEAAIDIQHTPLSCVPVDRYARVSGRTAGQAARADLQFRADAAGGWYSVRMTERGGEWSAFLPRPTSSVRQIEYRIAMTASDATPAATDPVTVPVRDAASCDAPFRASVEAPIVITVPEGAPAVPPVPPGFSPAGVVPPPERASLTRKRLLAGAIAGAAVLGGTAAAVVGSSSDPVRPGADLPEVRFNGTSPTPGSVLAPFGTPVAILMELGPSRAFVLSLTWSVEFRNSAGRTCLSMGGLIALREALAGRPATSIELAGTLNVPFGNPGCGARFDTETVRITVTNHDTSLYDQTHALPFRFQP